MTNLKCGDGRSTDFLKVPADSMQRVFTVAFTAPRSTSVSRRLNDRVEVRSYVKLGAMAASPPTQIDTSVGDHPRLDAIAMLRL